MTTPNETTQDTSLHDRWLAEQLEDPEFRAEYEREGREIAVIDHIVNTLDGLRAARGMSKADRARDIGKNPASVQRLLTARGNPELRTIVAIAAALGAEIKIVPRVINGMVVQTPVDATWSAASVLGRRFRPLERRKSCKKANYD